MKFEEFIQTLKMEDIAKKVNLETYKKEIITMDKFIEIVFYMNTKLFIEILREYDKWKSENK